MNTSYRTRRSSCISTRRGARGVTLIELMIGMLLGLVVVLVVAQVLSFSEGQKRITTGGADAQVNGALALYSVQREIQMAGYGLSTDKTVLGCPVHANHATAGPLNWTLAPVTIVDGANDAPDSISLLSSARAFAVPMAVSVDHGLTADRFTVRSALGVSVGDMVLAVPEAAYDAGNWCAAYSVTEIVNTNQLVHGASPWNLGTGVSPTEGYKAGSRLLNAGTLVNRSFSVTDAYMLRQQTMTSNAAAAAVEDLFPQIVNLQAMYGKDSNGDGVVDGYDNVTPTTNAGWGQVLSVRLAVVARSASYQKDEVTVAQPLWDVGSAVPVAGSAACGSSQCLTLKVNGLADWKHYRYSVYEVVAPLRNMLWGG